MRTSTLFLCCVAFVALSALSVLAVSEPAGWTPVNPVGAAVHPRDEKRAQTGDELCRLKPQQKIIFCKQTKHANHTCCHKDAHTSEHLKPETEKTKWVHYMQCDPKWGHHELGTQRGETICQAGCAMSSVAMALASKGLKSITPLTLNNWLVQHNGYSDHDLLNWAAIDNLPHTPIKFYNYWHGARSIPLSKLKSLVLKGYLPVVNVRNGGHWVLVTGFVGGSTFRVEDAAFKVNTYTYADMSNFVVYHA